MADSVSEDPRHPANVQQQAERLVVLATAYLLVQLYSERADVALRKLDEYQGAEKNLSGAWRSSDAKALWTSKRDTAKEVFFATMEGCQLYDPFLYPEFLVFDASKEQNMWASQVINLRKMVRREFLNNPFRVGQRLKLGTNYGFSKSYLSGRYLALYDEPDKRWRRMAAIK